MRFTTLITAALAVVALALAMPIVEDVRAVEAVNITLEARDLPSVHVWVCTGPGWTGYCHAEQWNAGWCYTLGEFFQYQSLRPDCGYHCDLFHWEGSCDYDSPAGDINRVEGCDGSGDLQGWTSMICMKD